MIGKGEMTLWLESFFIEASSHDRLNMTKFRLELLILIIFTCQGRSLWKYLFTFWSCSNVNIYCLFFFNVGPPKEDIFSGHLLWSIWIHHTWWDSIHRPPKRSYTEWYIDHWCSNDLSHHGWININCCKFLVMFAKFWSYSFGHINSVMWLFLMSWTLFVSM